MKGTAQGAVLVLGDLVCFLVFALLGLRSHEDGITLGSVLRAAGPFQVGWLAAVFALDLSERPSTSRNVLAAWLPAWIIGLVLRTVAVGRAFAPTFAIVALITNAALLLLWRCVLAGRLPRAGDRSRV